MSEASPTPTEAEIGAELERYIRERFMVTDDDDLFDRDVNLWEEGYVDSTGVVEVLAHIEHTWQRTIPDDVLFDPDFTFISGMARLIAELPPEEGIDDALDDGPAAS